MTQEQTAAVSSVMNARTFSKGDIRTALIRASTPIEEANAVMEQLVTDALIAKTIRPLAGFTDKYVKVRS